METNQEHTFNKNSLNFKKLLNRLILVFPVIIYIVVWYYIDYSQLIGLTENVFDLGINMQSGWNYFHYFSLDILNHVHPILLFFFPLFLFKNYQLLLLLQVVFVGLCYIPIYFIALKITKSTIISFIISISYLVNPLTIGMTAFTFHFQIFFPFFFLIGVYFYIEKRYRTSSLFFIISGLFKYQFLLFSALFSIVELSLIVYKGKNNENVKLNKTLSKKNVHSLLLQLVVSLGLFFSIFLTLSQHAGPVTSAYATLQFVLSSSSFLNNIIAKVITILILFLMTGFIFIFSKKWIIYMIPFFILLFFGNNSVYEVPNLFGFQYSSLIVPFLYLAMINGYSKFEGKVNLNRRGKQINPKTVKNFKKVFIGVSIIFVILMAGLYQPYSPVHIVDYSSVSVNNTKTQSEMVYSSVMSEINLIPPNNPYVVFQNNLPELLPRPYGTDITHLNMWESPFVQVNGTDTFLTINKSGNWVNASIDYAMEDPYSVWFYVTNQITFYDLPHNTSEDQMYGVVNALLHSKKYGILAEEDGVLLLKYLYSGPLVSYVPYKKSITFGETLTSNKSNCYNSKSSLSLFLSPGTYDINFSFLRNNPHIGANSQVVISYNNQQNIANIFNLSKVINQSKEQKNINFEFTVPDDIQYGNVFITLKNITNTSVIKLNSFLITQISPPP